MKVLQRKLSVRIFLAVCSFLGTILSLMYGFFFIYDGISFVPVVLIFTIGFAVVFLVIGLNVLMARVEMRKKGNEGIKGGGVDFA